MSYYSKQNERLDWRTVILYGVATGAALGVFILFAFFLADQIGLITRIILIFGTIAATVVTAWCFVRFLSAAIISKQMQKPFGELWQNIRENRSDPVGAIEASQAEIFEIARSIKRNVSLVIAFSAILAVTAEITLLVTAAVSFLQAERLEEQNARISEQTDVMSAQLLNEATTSLDVLTKQVLEKEQARRFIDDRLASETTFKHRMQDQFGPEREVSDWTLASCSVAEAGACNTLTFGGLAAHFGAATEFVVSKEQEPALNLLAALPEVMEVVGDIIWYQPDITVERSVDGSQLQATFYELQSRYWESIRTCGGTRDAPIFVLRENLDEAVGMGVAMSVVEIVFPHEEFSGIIRLAGQRKPGESDRPAPKNVSIDGLPIISQPSTIDILQHELTVKSLIFETNAGYIALDNAQDIFRELEDISMDLSEVMNEERPQQVGIEEFFSTLSRALVFFEAETQRLILKCDAEIAQIEEAQAFLRAQVKTVTDKFAAREYEGLR